MPQLTLFKLHYINNFIKIGYINQGAKCWITLDMLTCFKDYERYIHILNCILDLAWPKSMKLTLEQQYMLSVLQSQYHAY